MDLLVPELPPGDTPAVTISLGKGSGNLPNASVSGTINTRIKGRMWSFISLSGSLFLFYLSFFPHYISTVHGFLLWKIGPPFHPSPTPVEI